VKSAGAALGDVVVDVLVNNAGTMGQMAPFQEFDLADAIHTFDVNALGALRVTRALMPRLLAGKTRKVVSISSGMGSIGETADGGSYGYRMSKAALNMGMKTLSVDMRHEKLIVAVMNPGWVKTDMGGKGAPTTVEESASRMIGRIAELTIADSGTFLDFRGGTLPW
jgi:NAD(P)-dependent dehydrogenase (short-subunit alcohol dehydrogenase family)